MGTLPISPFYILHFSIASAAVSLTYVEMEQAVALLAQRAVHHPPFTRLAMVCNQECSTGSEELRGDCYVEEVVTMVGLFDLRLRQEKARPTSPFYILHFFIASVDRGRIELPTHGFSGRCSTD